MYRRYYPRFDRPGEEPQRPMASDTSAENDNTANFTHEHTEAAVLTEPEIIIPEKPAPRSELHTTTSPNNSAAPAWSAGFSNLFGGFSNLRRDDIMLLALVLMLFIEGVQDEMLLLILVFLFFIGF